MKFTYSQLILGTCFLAYAFPASAQVKVPPRIKQPPKIDIQLLEPETTQRRTDTPDHSPRIYDEEGPIRSLSTSNCAAFEIYVTKLAYQINCRQRHSGTDNLIEADKYSKVRLIIRRDGTQPSWALDPDSLDMFYQAAWDKSFKSNDETQQPLHYVRQVQWLPERSVPAQYCYPVPLSFRDDVTFNGSCHDIATITYKVVEGRK